LIDSEVLEFKLRAFVLLRQVVFYFLYGMFISLRISDTTMGFVPIHLQTPYVKGLIAGILTRQMCKPGL
jgi:hypothetical protein